MKNGNAEAAVTIVLILLGLISLGVYGWSTLPQHQAKADTTTALIPYWQEQEAIETQQMYVDAKLREERAAKVHPYKTAAGVAVFLLAIGVMAAVGSYTAVFSYHQGQRVARQARLPVMQQVGEHHVLLGDGQNSILWNLATGRSDAALTAVKGDEDMAQLMRAVLVTRELAKGAEAVAKHTKDPSTGDYLLGQVENITNETINESKRAD